MNNKNNNNEIIFLNNEIIKNPYPILIQENFLDTDLYNELLKNFPKENDFGKAFRMHGELTYPDVNYNKLLEKECWKKLHDYIYSKDFVDKILNYFNNELKEQKDLLINIDDIEYELEYEGRDIKKSTIQLKVTIKYIQDLIMDMEKISMVR